MTTNDVGSGKTKYFTELAVSFRTKHRHPWVASNLQDCLSHKIQPNRAKDAPTPIVICRFQEKHEKDSEFYVEARTPEDLKKLLALNDTKISSYGIHMYPTIEPWDLHRSKEGSSRTNRPQNEEKDQNYYGPSKKDNSERKDRDADANIRPLKRPRVGTSESPSSKKNILYLEKKMSDKTNPNSNGSSNQSPDCKLHLTKHPKCTQKYFLDYLNNHIQLTKMIGVSDGAVGQPPILTCTPDTGDGWVLETRTPKIASSIINQLSGKLVLLKTRLHFQRKSNLSIPPPPPSPKRRLSHSESAIRSPPPLPNWSQDECKVFCYSKKVSHFEVKDFFNSFMKKSGLYDCNVVSESRTIHKNCLVSVFLCISPDAAQSIVDELHNIPFKNTILNLKRHNHFQKHTENTAEDDSIDNSNTADDPKKKPTAPSNSEKQPENSPKKATSPANKAKVATKDPKIVVVPSNVARRVSIEAVPRKAVALADTARQVAKDTAPNTSTAISSGSDSSTDSVPTADAEIAKLKAKNENVTKQLMKLLKENKDLKKQNEKLAKEASSGSHKEPIVLADSGDETDMKRKYKAVSSQLDDLKVEKTKRDFEFVEMQDDRDKLKEQLKESERSCNEIHESWRKQETVIDDQKELINRLKEGLEEETAQKQQLEAKLKENEEESRQMKDALMKATCMHHEERATRNAMTLDLVRFRKAKKQAERALKRHLTRVKDEDKYDA
eukprot:CAMPEP_0116145384 /NCGR_PEP_ID=MMETSP0329-20121206/16560_1 /TAXON_ID=697910 /ORGANISM="Pseudo-nitzschia arenysensis, Strain B593" /LENGTH=722 /DNA_ID=CAMNT_0003640977 /DNA_START=188 /DNA_END=2356 /DNA_ORIENTATION=+